MLKPDHKEREGNDRFEGFLIDLMYGIADKMDKFEFALYESPDGNYGSKVDGKWNGMIRELIVGVSVTCIQKSQPQKYFSILGDQSLSERHTCLDSLLPFVFYYYA